MKPCSHDRLLRAAAQRASWSSACTCSAFGSVLVVVLPSGACALGDGPAIEGQS